MGDSGLFSAFQPARPPSLPTSGRAPQPTKQGLCLSHLNKVQHGTPAPHKARRVLKLRSPVCAHPSIVYIPSCHRASPPHAILYQKSFGTEGQTIAQGGSKRLGPGDPGAYSQLSPGVQDDSAPSAVVSITGNGETRSIFSYKSSKASLSSEPQCCQRTIQSISLFKHRNDSKPLPGEKPPRSQPASFHPSLFLVQLGLSQEGVGQIPLRTCGVCDSAVIALCDGAGFAGGGDPTAVPAALCSVGAVHYTGVLAAQ